MTLLILNGPNLNLLGEREPQIYGQQRFEEYLDDLRTDVPDLNLIYHQSNLEGELINLLHEYRNSVEGIILNAGGYTHTSIALADAIAAISVPVIEVHLSNIHAREAFRKTSFIAPVCIGSISGFGLESYRLALQFFVRSLPGT